MRFTAVLAASLLGLAAASPCKRKTTTLTASGTTLTSTATSVLSTETSAVSTSSAFTSSTSVASASIPSSSSSVDSTTSVASTSSVISTTAESTTSATFTTFSQSTTSTASTTSAASTTATSSASTFQTTISATLTPTQPSTTTFSTTSTSVFQVNPATAVVTNPVALSFYDPSLDDGTQGRDPPTGDYTCFAGPAINFPPQNTWASFNVMWDLLSRQALIAIGDTPQEAQYIKTSILSVSQLARVDPRVILAVVVLESTGNVRVGCTTSFGGVNNCGLMQSYNGRSFDASDPQGSIYGMIQDGVQGTTSGPGLVQHLNSLIESQGDLWTALRFYNSGSADPANLSDGRGATDSYVSNIANFVQGWVGYGSPGPANCDFSNPVDTTPVAN